LQYQLSIVKAAPEHLEPGNADLLDIEDVSDDEYGPELHVCHTDTLPS
jgi:hypothetical protein